MRSTTLLLCDLATGLRVPVRATVEDIDDATCRVSVGAVGVVMAAEQVREAEAAVGAAERWERRAGSSARRGGA